MFVRFHTVARIRKHSSPGVHKNPCYWFSNRSVHLFFMLDMGMVPECQWGQLDTTLETDRGCVQCANRRNYDFEIMRLLRYTETAITDLHYFPVINATTRPPHAPAAAANPFGLSGLHHVDPPSMQEQQSESLARLSSGLSTSKSGRGWMRSGRWKGTFFAAMRNTLRKGVMIIDKSLQKLRVRF